MSDTQPISIEDQLAEILGYERGNSRDFGVHTYPDGWYEFRHGEYVQVDRTLNALLDLIQTHCEQARIEELKNVKRCGHNDTQIEYRIKFLELGEE